MIHTQCNSCGNSVAVGRGEAYCPTCRRPLAGEEGWKIAGKNLRTAARCQRRIIWFVLAMLGMNLFQCAVPSLLVRTAGIDVLDDPESPVWFLFFCGSALGGLALQIAALVNVIVMLGALRISVVGRVLYALFMFIPLINLFLLLTANQRATRALKKAGLKVGFMGVRDEEVVKLLSLSLCARCGYDLTGNVSGTCPECGEPARMVTARPVF